MPVNPPSNAITRMMSRIVPRDIQALPVRIARNADQDQEGARQQPLFFKLTHYNKYLKRRMRRRYHAASDRRSSVTTLRTASLPLRHWPRLSVIIFTDADAVSLRCA